MKKHWLIVVILLIVLLSLSCNRDEYNASQRFIDSCKYKITVLDDYVIRYANSYVVKDGFVIIEEYVDCTWESIYPISQKKLMLPASKIIIQELR